MIIELGCGDKPRVKDSIKVYTRNIPDVDIVADFNKSLPIAQNQ